MYYNNPIIRGFHPDPSICKAGTDYYLVTSSFEYCPGIPVYHSRDLVNWRQIGNCINAGSGLPFRGAGDSGGIWAPTIRYWKGVFYVTATMDGHGNFVVSTKDIRGEWSEPVWIQMGGIDPSLYFEGDGAYYCTNQSLHPGQEEITMARIDILTGKLAGEMKTLWTGIGGGFLEAPHIYRIGEWYYLTVAEGGTNFNHMVTVARSKSLWGSYENYPYNPVLSNRHDTSKEVQCTGHGDLVQDDNGNWWMVHLGIRLSRRTMSHLGRETFLTPVSWREGWPVAGKDGKARLTEEGPLWEEQKEQPGFTADFSREGWEPQWIFLREPDLSCYCRKEGRLMMKPSFGIGDRSGSPSFAAVRQCDFTCRVETGLYFDPSEDGEEAGLLIYLSSEFYYRFAKKRVGGEDFLVVEKKAEDFEQTACRIKIEEGRLRLVIEADKTAYHFYYSVGEEGLQPAGTASTRFLSCELAGKCFTGTVIGIYTLSAENRLPARYDLDTGTAAVTAEFDGFHCVPSKNRTFYQA